MTGARYAALGVLNDERTGLDRFVTVGIDAGTQRAIGDLPRGRGVLGALIADPQPLRLSDVGAHPQSFGFPHSHPPMRSFLGVPITVRGHVWGNLYLTEKDGGGDFTQADEEAVCILAEWAAIAIENARLYQGSEQRRESLEQAVRALEAARDIADAIGTEADLERILELIVKRGRALVDSQAVLIMLREGQDLVVVAAAGRTEDARGRRIPISGSTSGLVMERGASERIVDVASRLRVAPADLGVPDARTALLVPMFHRGVALGVLAAFDHGEEHAAFSPEDEQLLRTFAASAANAVAIARSVEADRIRGTITAAEEERRRWARELHDETLQALGSLRVLLAAAVRRADPARSHEAMVQAIEDIEREIENLRAIISDLRPALLDDLGLQPAIEALVDRRRADGLQISLEFEASTGDASPKVAPELETTVYRFVQESLTNVVKHARASSVQVTVQLGPTEIVAVISDDGAGFDADAPTEGFGLAGLRERVYLSGGQLELSSDGHGTSVRARMPTTGG